MPLNLLFAINDGYCQQLMTTLYSIRQACPGENFDVYVLQNQPLTQAERLHQFCQLLGMRYYPLVIPGDDFQDAPATDRYPATIYYRLLAHEYLPSDMERILYLDADLLCLNDLRPFYQMAMGDALYAAASHVPDANVLDWVNKLRLQNFEAESYYNSGVLLMNLTAIRQGVKRQAIMDYIAKNSLTLLLPDQDVLNALYGHQILSVPDQLYNYDARYNILYYSRSRGEWDLDWVINHTVFLHFCGRDKPWLKGYIHRYSGLYKQYAKQAQDLLKRDQDQQ